MKNIQTLFMGFLTAIKNRFIKFKRKFIVVYGEWFWVIAQSIKLTAITLKLKLAISLMAPKIVVIKIVKHIITKDFHLFQV